MLLLLCMHHTSSPVLAEDRHDVTSTCILSRALCLAGTDVMLLASAGT